MVIVKKAHATPKKIGQFVTIYKRINGYNEPFSVEDNLHAIIVEIEENSFKGKFIFDKATLIKYEIITNGEIIGKMAMRVYAPWHKPSSNQALRTQKWQTKYFEYV